MEKFMYPSPYIRITQGYMLGTHTSSYAIDEAGSDTGKDYLIAPYSGTVKQIYSQYENEVFFESDNPVLFADGTQDYAVTMFVHQDSPMAYNMAVGRHYNQGDKIYIEGGRYQGQNAHFANHCHLEFAQGKYSGSGWYKNASGYYSLNNAKKPEDCCFIDDSYRILDSNGYRFKNVNELQPKTYGNPVAREENKNQIQINADNVRARNAPNGSILGYMNEGIYDSLEIVSEAGYKWHRVEDNLWFANGSWATWFPRKEEPKNEEEKSDQITQLQNQLTDKTKEIDSLKEKNNELMTENKSLQERLDSMQKPKLIFTCKKEDYYAVKLQKEQKLYLD